MEKWKDIAGYEGIYQVSNHGRVRSLDRKVDIMYAGVVPMTKTYKGQILKPYLRGNSTRYECVNLRTRETGKNTCSVHRLVLKAFVGEPPSGFVCCHNDGNPLNNRLDNLRWGTPSENMQDMVRHGNAGMAKGEDHGCALLTEEQVIEMRKIRKTGETYEKIAERYGVDKCTIALACTGKTWSHLPGAVDLGRKGNSRFTDEQRQEMLERGLKGESASKIAREFSCSRSYISKMVKTHRLESQKV